MASDPHNNRWTHTYPNLETQPLPLDPYLSKDNFELERVKRFARMWLCTGKRTEEILHVGEGYFTLDIGIARTSVVVIHGKDGKLRCFHNVCKHRGNRLTSSSHGKCRSGLTCCFHGWTYACDGQLIGAPEEDMFFDFRKQDYGLSPVAVTVWEGFIFVHLDPSPSETLRSHLGKLPHLLQGYPFNRLPLTGSYRAELRCNWRILRDSQLEFYHGKTLHERFAAGPVINRDQPSSHVLDARLFGRHSMVSFFGDRGPIACTPMERLMAQFGTTLKTCPSVRELEKWLPGVNPKRSRNWLFNIYYVFPNFHVVILSPFLYVTHTVWPETVNTSTWNARGYFPRPANAAECVTTEFNKCLARDVWLEDGSTLEDTQRGIESGAMDHYPLQDQELLIRHAHRVAENLLSG